VLQESKLLSNTPRIFLAKFFHSHLELSLYNVLLRKCYKSKIFTSREFTRCLTVTPYYFYYRKILYLYNPYIRNQSYYGEICISNAVVSAIKYTCAIYPIYVVAIFKALVLLFAF
jgi:hypothetical protein